MVDTVPPWLESMRADLGVEEIPGSAVNPRIIAKARLPGVKFPNVPGLVAYGLTYKSDDTQAWCAAECGGCLAEVGIMPPFGPGGYDRYFWAASFEPWGVACSIRVGAIVCFKNHVAIINRIIDANTIEVIGGNQGSPKGGAVTKSTRKVVDVRATRWPDDASLAAAGLSQFSLSAAPGITTTPFQPEIKIGSTGGFVTEAQNLLGLAATGIFDAAMDAAVREFQSRHALSMVDGEIGDETWPVLRASKGQPAPVTSASLSPEAIARIVSIAGSSALAGVNWSGRGVAPRGYIKGMAVTFAKVYLDLKAGGSSARAMAAAVTGNDNFDALFWYDGVLRKAGVDILRRLFALLIGLGMRESSGNYSEGRDTSASNVSSDTAEAGLFQQSWNSRVASPELAKLFAAYSAGNVDGFLSIFREGVNEKSTDDAGTGEGMAFQHLCKTKPAFAVECAAVGLRVLRQHWGPINRKEAELRPEADALLQQVQQVVDAVVTKPIAEPIIIPPKKPGEPLPDTGATNPLLLIGGGLLVLMQFLEQSKMDKPSGQGFDLGKLMADLPKFLALLQNPVLQKVISNQPVTLQELLTVVPVVLQLMPGHAAPALPAPDKPVTEPQPVPVDPAPAPPITGSNPGVVKASAWGLAISTVLQALGVVGTPLGVGAEPTTAGTLATVVPILTAGLGAVGGFSPLINIGVKLLGGFATAFTKPK